MSNGYNEYGLPLFYECADEDDEGMNDSLDPGEPCIPEPGWNQGAGSPSVPRWYKAKTRWGDRQVLEFPPTTAGPAITLNTLQILQFNRQLPLVCTLRLSCVDISGVLTSASANAVVTWTVDVGCGSAMQTKIYQAQVAPTGPGASTDLTLTLPLSACRVTASVTVTMEGALDIECVTAIAPFFNMGDIEE
jgi:hypothetical protein